jgi:hypothetical protein
VGQLSLQDRERARLHPDAYELFCLPIQSRKGVPFPDFFGQVNAGNCGSINVINAFAIEKKTREVKPLLDLTAAIVPKILNNQQHFFTQHLTC